MKTKQEVLVHNVHFNDVTTLDEEDNSISFLLKVSSPKGKKNSPLGCQCLSWYLPLLFCFSVAPLGPWRGGKIYFKDNLFDVSGNVRIGRGRQRTSSAFKRKNKRMCVEAEDD